MNPFDRIANISPLPIVDLSHPTKPRDGLVFPLTKTCHEKYDKGNSCQRHYEQLAMSSPVQRTIVQCPFGFASAAFSTATTFSAVTGFVPFPRLGGSQESIVAKRHKDSRISTDAVQNAINGIVEADKHFLALEENVLKGHSMALHEIRKLNRAIKQNAERLCRKESPNDLDLARKELVTIYKSSELMSNEFDVIEVLADATQTTLPLNTVIEIYKIFDKCVRIYNTQAGGRHVVLRATTSTYSPRVVASDKTLHIIPSVLIENSLKYSTPGSETRIFLEPDLETSECIVTVVNESEGNQSLDNRVFQRGFRFDTRRDGSGNGLYVAQLIAKQHGTRITVQSEVTGPNSIRHTFSIRIKTTTERWLKKPK
jgi:signal transduction histidine kinase